MTTVATVTTNTTVTATTTPLPPPIRVSCLYMFLFCIHSDTNNKQRCPILASDANGSEWSPICIKTVFLFSTSYYWFIVSCDIIDTTVTYVEHHRGHHFDDGRLHCGNVTYLGNIRLGQPACQSGNENKRLHTNIDAFLS